jgi:hypothetical protein
LPTIDNIRKNSKIKQYRKATTTLAMAILALTLAFSGMGSIINSASAQTLRDNGTDDNLGQTTTPASVTDIESRRLSILGALGFSLVDNVKVTAIALNENATEVTVTLSNTDNATAPSAISPNVSNETNSSTTTGTTATTPGVTVAAFKTKLDLMGLLQAHMMMGKSQSEMPPMTDSQGNMMTMQNHGQMGTMSGSGMSMFDIMSFIEKLEIGSNIKNEGWTSPSEITVPVINGSAENGTSSIMTTATSGTSDTDVVVIVVIPYTGETGAIGQNSTNLSQP